jgi:hypothetical protein
MSHKVRFDGMVRFVFLIIRAEAGVISAPSKRISRFAGAPYLSPLLWIVQCHLAYIYGVPSWGRLSGTIRSTLRNLTGTREKPSAQPYVGKADEPIVE